MTNYKLMVCPHDTAKNPERWYSLARHLSDVLDGSVSFHHCLNFEEFHEHLMEADILYGNPQDTLNLVKNHNFTPLVHPEGMFDEVVFVADEHLDHPTLEGLAGQTVGTVVSMLPTKIALHLLAQQNVQLGEVVNYSSWQGVINNIIKGNLTYGFVYKDTYDGLSSMSKDMLQLFHTSTTQLAFHSLSISPKLVPQQTTLTEALTGLHQTEQGHQLMERLEIKQWLPIEPAEIDRMNQILTSF